MKLKSPLTLLIIFLMLVFSISLNAQERLISKAFKEIDENNFENAESKLKEAKTKSGNSPLYLFVMYKFYDVKSNHKFNIDSAHYYLLKTEEALYAINKKQSLEYCKEYQLCPEYFNDLKNTLAKNAYYVYASSNSIESLNEYKNKYFSYPFTNLADEKIDTLLFTQAENQNTIDAFEVYLKKTSLNMFKSIAELKIEELAYNKTKEINTIEAFNDYLAKYPKAHNFTEAQEKLYNIAWAETSKLNKEKFYLEYFINYPNSSFATESKKRYLKSAVLVPFKKSNEKRIYVDKDTLIPIITEEFDSADFFVKDYAVATKYHNDIILSGIINKKGETLVPLEFDFIQMFDDGNSILKRGEKYFFYNTKINKISEFPENIKLQHYYQGIISVFDRSLELESGRYYFIDENGVKLFGRNFYMAVGFENFGKGLSWVMNYSDFKTGYIDTKGILQIPFVISGPGFLDKVGVIINNPNKWGLTDFNGNEITIPIFDEMNTFANDLSLVKIKIKYGYIDKYGEIVIPINFDFARSFSEKLAVFGSLDNKQKFKYGIIDILGNIVLEPKYNEILDFSESYAGYKMKEKWGFINQKGEEIIQCKYDEINSFHEGLAAVKLNGYWGFINQYGKQVIECRYSLPEYSNPSSIDFKNGFANVYDGTRKGVYIDKLGREFWESQ